MRVSTFGLFYVVCAASSNSASDQVDAALLPSMLDAGSSNGLFVAEWLSPSIGATYNISSQVDMSLGFYLNATETIPLLSLILCQIDNSSQTPSYFKVIEILELYLYVTDGCNGTVQTSNTSQVLTTSVVFEDTDVTMQSLLDNLFYCFADSRAINGNGNAVCASNTYSPIFNFNGEPVDSSSLEVQALTSPITLLTTFSILALLTSASPLAVTSPSTAVDITTTPLGTIAPSSTGSSASSASIATEGRPTTSCLNCITTSTPPASTSFNKPSSSFSTIISSSSSIPPHGLTSDSKIGISISILLASLSFISFSLFCIHYMKQRRLRYPKNIAELPLGGHHEKAELEAVERPGELETNAWDWLGGEK